MTIFSPGGGCSEVEVVDNKEINLISLETAMTEGWPVCLQTTNLTVYNNQDHMLSFEKVKRLGFLYKANNSSNLLFPGRLC